jgi:hypothetical protein
MVHNFKDLTGVKFGLLTVLNYEGTNKNKKALWKCRCECGSIITTIGSYLRSGHTKSCGCTRHEKLMERNTTHGMAHTHIHYVWIGMKQRCYNINHKNYQHYGGRGIIICEEWKNSFENFYNWAINNGYNDNLSIDRIDVNGNYEPINCRWVDMKTQQNNKRNNHNVEIDGEIHTIAEWSKLNNIDTHTISSRVHRNHWDPIDAVTIPVGLSKEEIDNYKYIMNSIDEEQDKENIRSEEEYIQDMYLSDIDIKNLNDKRIPEVEIEWME